MNRTPATAALLAVAPTPTLHGKVVLITGASRGLGGAIADLLGADGARLVIADIAEQRAYDKVRSLEERGIEALAVRLDVGDESSVRNVVAATLERFGRLDVLVNNAAIDVTAPLAEIEADDWNKVLHTNLGGPFLMSKHCAAAMRSPSQGQSGGGHIVNIASTASKRAWPNAAAYHATKWGLLGLSHALHAELRPEGILVSAIVAGGMRTPFLLDRFPDIDPEVLQEPANVARAVRFVLLQPPGTVIPELTVLPVRETSWP